VSVLSYNNVILPYSYTTQFTQEAVHDPVSKTDFTITKYDISISTIINANYLAQLFPSLLDDNDNPQTNNAADIMNAIRNRLLKPRKALSFTFNGVETIPKLTGNRGTVDAQNGPTPISCTYTQLQATTFLMSYRIVAQYFDFPSVDPEGTPVVTQRIGSPILYNRWTESVDIDNCNYTTRRRDGEYGIRSDNASGQTADFFRSSMAQLGVPPGFLRQSSKYTVDPSGLAIKYSIIDKEQYKMPPVGAYEAHGQYIETTPTRCQPIRYGECRLRLKGGKVANLAGVAGFAGAAGASALSSAVSQEKLIELAVTVVSSKLFARGGQLQVLNGSKNSKFALIESATLTVDLYENIVEFHMKVMYQCQKNAISFINPITAFNTVTTFTPLSDGVVQNPPSYPLRGTAGILLQAAAYYDPALIGTTVDPKTGQLSKGLVPGQAGTTAES